MDTDIFAAYAGSCLFSQRAAFPDVAYNFLNFFSRVTKNDLTFKGQNYLDSENLDYSLENLVTLISEWPDISRF